MRVVLYAVIIACQTIKFSVLYEKSSDPYLKEINRFLVCSILEEYNDYLDTIGLNIKLDKIYDYSEYSKVEAFKEFSGLAGSDSLKERIKALVPIEQNLIILYSSPDESGQSEKTNSLLNSKANPCKSRYFGKLQDDLSVVICQSVQKWLEVILRIEVPEYFNLGKKFLNALRDTKIVSDLSRCSYDYEELESYADDKYNNNDIASREDIYDNRENRHDNRENRHDNRENKYDNRENKYDNRENRHVNRNNNRENKYSNRGSRYNDSRKNRDYRDKSNRDFNYDDQNDINNFMNYNRFDDRRNGPVYGRNESFLNNREKEQNSGAKEKEAKKKLLSLSYNIKSDSQNSYRISNKGEHSSNEPESKKLIQKFVIP
jgi:hypothetical protein